MNAMGLGFAPGLTHYLALATILFVLGIFIILTKRNGIRLLMGVELILNAACVNLIAFNHYVDPGLDGQIFAIFVIVLAAAEAAVALAIVLAIYQKMNEINLDELTELKE